VTDGEIDGGTGIIGGSGVVGPGPLLGDAVSEVKLPTISAVVI
jgi:hypothetical protein